MAKRAHSKGRPNIRARQERPRASSTPASPVSPAVAAPPTPVPLGARPALRPSRASIGAAARTPVMDYSYVRHDLIRIAVLAAVLMGAMGTLAFIIR